MDKWKGYLGHSVGSQAGWAELPCLLQLCGLSSSSMCLPTPKLPEPNHPGIFMEVSLCVQGWLYHEPLINEPDFWPLPQLRKSKVWVKVLALQSCNSFPRSYLISIQKTVNSKGFRSLGLEERVDKTQILFYLYHKIPLSVNSVATFQTQVGLWLNSMSFSYNKLHSDESNL